MSTGCSYASQHPESTEEDVSPPPPIKKYSIIVDMEGAKGRDANKWSSRCGVLIREHIPVSYENWRKVDDFYKKKLWKALMEEFDMNLDQELARPILERNFSQYFRAVKSKLRKKYLKKDGEFVSRRVAINNRPKYIDKVQWKKFVDIEYTDEKKKQCKRNAENRGKHTITSTLGRKSYIRLYEELEVENPECKPTRAMVWKAAHKNRKTGEVLPCAAEKFALIEAAEERHRSEASVGNDGVTSLQDFERDPVAEAFGDDKKKSYRRAISSTSSIKHVKLTQVSKAIIKNKENEDKQWRTEIKHKQSQMHEGIRTMNSTLADVQKCIKQFVNQTEIEHNQSQMHEEIRTMNSTLADVQKCIKQFLNQTGEDLTSPRKEFASNMEQHPSSLAASLGTPSNAIIGSSAIQRREVVLLSDDLKEVAKGHVGMQKFCHGRRVVDGEKVVWVDDVLNPDAPLFEAPQNGHYTLSELVDGGCVIWPEYRMRCL